MKYFIYFFYSFYFSFYFYLFIYLLIYLFIYLFILFYIYFHFLFILFIYLFIYFHFIYLFFLFIFLCVCVFFFCFFFFFHANLPYCLTLLWVTLSFSDQCIYLCKQCRFIWDGSLRAVSSGSALFIVLFFVFLTKTHICKNVRDQTRRWNSPFHKHWGERVYSNTIS